MRPGAYPWPNHRNAWRPNHIHFSYFGPAFATRLITQMYFPGDPLLAFDPIFNAVPDPHARNRLVARSTWTSPSRTTRWATGSTWFCAAATPRRWRSIWPMPIATASQTIGPVLAPARGQAWADLTRFGAAGEKITLTGAVLDGDGKPCADACVEIWQSDPPASDSFPASAAATPTRRALPVRDGEAGAGAGRGNAQQAPHIAINMLSRGLMHGLVTRAYFHGEALNETDPLLVSIEDPARRATLIARPAGNATWRLDIRLQGEGETVFLDV